MKVAFFTGMKFSKVDGKYYHITLKHDIIKERYLSVFDEFVVFGSEQNGDENTSVREELSSGPNVTFRLSQKYHNGSDEFKPWVVSACKKEIRNLLNDVDCAIIRLPSNIGIWACKECEKIGKPYVIEVVGCVFDSLYNFAWYTKPLAYFERYKMKKAVSKAKYTTYVSKHFLQERYPSDSISTNCSNVRVIDFDEGIIDKRLSQIDMRRKESDRVLRFCTCSGIDIKYKGHEYVFRAMKELEKEGINTEYYLAGSGSPEMLTNLAKNIGVLDRIHFLGQVKHESVISLLDQTDIYIQPSLAEGLPRALIEAMSRGCPSTGSRVAGIPELLPDELIFEPKDVVGICNRVKYIMKNERDVAKQLFETSKDYDIEIIEKNRHWLLSEFRDSINT
ncbi:MAG: glycosyltransferase family 4 protein [Clostridia bacterium]|nr:glycosyltransferase family 4 protein [Clostridia bacterium]